MKYLPWLFVGAIIAAALIRDRFVHPLRARIDTLTVHVAEADTVRIRDSIRVVRNVYFLDTVRQTVLEHLTDTLRVREFIRQTDTLRLACMACVASASRLKVVTDSLNMAHIQLERALHPKWTNRLNITAGVDLRGKPNLVAGVRLWP